MSHICINIPSSHFGLQELIEHSFSSAVISAGQGVCELTNQRRVCILDEGLKETGAKSERFRQCCRTRQYGEKYFVH